MARLGQITRQMRTALHMRRRWVALLAVFALVAQVVVPFGQAMALDAGIGVEYQVICTASGVKQIPVNADGTPVDAQAAVSCPFCSLTTAPALFSPTADTVITIDDTRVSLTFAQPIGQIPTSIWRGSPRPSRAPPLSV